MDRQIAPQRRLSAIVSADVVGYSRLMQADDQATHKALTELRTAVSQQVGNSNGRIVNVAGDSILAEFASVLDAVECAVNIQQRVVLRNSAIAEDRRMQMRIGVNVGDVLVDASGIYGNGVNVAARLESLCPPGGVAVSDKVYEEVRDKLRVRFIDLGEHEVKNIARPIHMYALDISSYGISAEKTHLSVPKKLAIPIGFAVVVVIAVLLTTPAMRNVLSGGTKGAVTPNASIRPFRSVAVLPLSIDSSAPGHKKFAEKFSRDLTAAVGTLLFDGVVASYGLVQPYAGKPYDLRSVGRDLNVRYVVDGTLRPGKESYRLDLEATDSVTGSQVWVYQATASPTALTESLRKIAGGFRSQLVDSTRKEVLSLPEPERSAWDLIIQAFDANSSIKNNEQVQRLIEEALRIDPQFRDALIMLCGALYGRIQDEPEKFDELMPRFDEVTARATDVLPNDPRSWDFRAYALVWQGNFSGAFAAVDKAFEVNPYWSRNYVAQADLLIRSGRAEESLPALDKADELNPADRVIPMIYRCLALVMLARDKEALMPCEAASGLYPYWTPYAFTTAAHANLGHTREAASWKAKLLESNPKLTISRYLAARWSQNPIALRQNQHIVDGLRKAGIPD